MVCSTTPCPSAPEREVIKEALLNLLDARDFLGYQRLAPWHYKNPNDQKPEENA
jgi:hypothetical protein